MIMKDISIAVFSFNGHQHLLPYCLKSIYKNAPDYEEIIVVWDDNVDWQPVDFDQLRVDTGVNFRVILHSQIYPWTEEINQWGWIKQQLAKLACHTYTNTKYTWIVDGDVLLTGDPNLFDPMGQPHLRYHRQSTNPAYNLFIKQYLDIHKFYPYDFVGSTCLFENDQCRKIDQHVQKISGMSLIDSVHHCIIQPNHDPWPFSEFQTYGTWIYNMHPDTHRLSERNWNYCQNERRYDLPVQIMWDQLPVGVDLDAKSQWLTNKSHSAIILE